MKAPVHTALYTILGVFAVSFCITMGAYLLSYTFSANSAQLAGVASSTTATSTATTTTATSTTATTASGFPLTIPPQTTTPMPPPQTSTFVYSFNSSETLQEAATVSKSSSPYWFLDSGGKLLLENGYGETIQGSLATGDKWQLAYAASNPTDTDGGYHPQNIFRLVTKQTWANVTSEAWFLITADNFSSSPNRNASNGLLLMNRYLDHNDLYYAGIRVDGTAVIKKKYNGVYYTLAQVPIFPGTYDLNSNPNLLPHQAWIGLRTSTVTNASGSVSIHLYMSQNSGTTWSLIASATDDGSYGNTAPITSAGSFGIRTDFMDVRFKNVRVTES